MRCPELKLANNLNPSEMLLKHLKEVRLKQRNIYYKLYCIHVQRKRQNEFLPNLKASENQKFSILKRNSHENGIFILTVPEDNKLAKLDSNKILRQIKNGI